MPFIVLWTITIGFISGILFGKSIVISLVLCLLTILFLLVEKQILTIPFLKRSILLFLFCVSFGLGFIRYTVSEVLIPTSFLESVGSKVVLTGQVVDDPDERSFSNYIVVRVGTVSIRISTKDRDIMYGDTVEISGRLDLPQNFITDTGREFDYVSYLEKDNISFVIQNAKVQVITRPESFSLKRELFRLKHGVTDIISKYLPGETGALLSGILIGTRSTLSDGFKQALIVTSTIHIVALSGYNVSIVADGIIKSLMYLVPRFIAYGFGIVGITIFVLLTGASSTAIRAGAMAVLLLVSRMLGRTTDALRLLCFAVLAILTYNPKLIVSDISFQLSILATLGLILIHPILFSYIQKKLPRYVADLLAGTLSAQIAVLPFIIHTTGLLSVIGLPVNLIILPFIPVVMLLGVPFIIIGAMSSVFGFGFGFVLHIILDWIISLIMFASTFPYAAIHIPSFGMYIPILFYCSIGLWIYMKREIIYDKET